ncbi:MAG: glycosyltransferase family 4 protein [Deltaproteobacteria bacterium]|nr:glycosyltransferase family 4 protein [Deltaproteobacteria bacterium]
MKILLVSGDYPPKLGGISVYGAELADHLARRPEVDRAWVLAFGRWDRAQEEDGPLTVLRRPRSGFFSQGLEIWRTVRRLKPDLIQVLTLFPEGFWVWLAAKLRGRPYFISLYGTETAAAGGRAATRWAKRRTLGRAAGLFPISRATAAKAAASFGLARDKMTVINPGLTSLQEPGGQGPTRASLGFGPEDIVVMTLTRLVKRKGVDYLIRALALLPERIRLVVVGEGRDRARLTELAQSLGLSDRVLFTGRVERTEPYYRLADIFVLAPVEDPASGDVEGFGIVLVEAQSLGLPVIGTDSGGVPEAFEPGRTGLLVRPGDAQALAQAVARLAHDPDLRQRLGREGPRLVAERYDWAVQAAGFVKAFEAVLGA